MVVEKTHPTLVKHDIKHINKPANCQGQKPILALYSIDYFKLR